MKILTKKQAGMSMLEVVVSMLVIGLGLAMTVSMIQASSRYGESAEYRATALNEIQSIADRMVANKLGGIGYVWGAPSYKTTGYQTNVTLVPTPPCTGTADFCADTKQVQKLAAQGIALQRAKADMEDWLGHIKTSLPNGQGAITQNNGVYTVTVMWRVSDESAIGNTSGKNNELLNMSFIL